MTTENSLPDLEPISTTEPAAPAGPPVAEAILKSLIAKTAASSETCVAQRRFVIPDGSTSPVGISGERGVIGASIAITRLALAKYEPGSNHAKQSVFLGTIDDVQLLHAIGFRGYSANHVRFLRGKGMFEPSTNFQYKFILVGSQISAFSGEVHSQVLSALMHLWAIENVFGVDVGQRFGVWLPDDDFVRRFRDAARCADRDNVARLAYPEVCSRSVDRQSMSRTI